ncbi:flagellin [Paremcibacter congregatus]|uniref:flagellin n=1 Tax=Paremcibacter congregatus TaxID=2043170 RepID=UPI0030EB4BCA|tara:strand:+ start:31040 stop:31882 length:843 start_codon:yes stop_codon:yes gene_type:complete
MAFSVNTNAGALFALQSLNKTNSQLDSVQSRINTGLKVASAKDNAAVFAIAQGQRADLAGLGAVKGSLDRASSSINVALAATEAVSDLLVQLKEKATASTDPGADAAARIALNDEFQNLIDQIDTVVNNAEFNGVNAVKNGGNAIQALTALADGTNTAGDYSITIAATDISASDGLGLTTAVDILDVTNASSSLALITTAETTLNTLLSKLGAGGKRIDIQRAFTDKLSDAIEIGIGNLVDADLARESANLQSLQVRQQLGLQALSIANQAPGSVLSLFR